jgi:hypothetical protein
MLSVYEKKPSAMFKHIDLMTDQRRKEEEFQTKNAKYCEALMPRLTQYLNEKMKNLYLI